MRTDLISRCKLFNQLATLPAPAEANTFKAEVYKIIQEMETEDRPRGEWETEYHGNGWNDHWDYTCSNCGKKYERADAVLCKANFCPNCGADMQRRDNDN